MNTRVKYAPIAIFAYSRADHLRRTIDSLLKNEEAQHTDLHVFCDGPRSEKEREAIDATREFVDTIQGFASITKIFHEKNMGLSRSIINGVTHLLGTHDSVIVMEDDLVVSPVFLQFMNDGLRCYVNDEKVASIQGYFFPTDLTLPETFFLRGADCWGWATWARAWRHFEPDGRKLLALLQENKLCRNFDLDGSYPYTTMLKRQIDGKNDSWAVRWRAACYLREMISLYPGNSLVNNIGFDSTGTHCTETDAYEQLIHTAPVEVEKLPLEESAEGRRALVRYCRKNHSIAARIRRNLPSFFR